MKKTIYSAIAIAAIAGVAYGVADHQANKIVKDNLTQWLQTHLHKKDSPVATINYDNVSTNGFFFFTRHFKINGITVKFKDLPDNAPFKLPELKIKTLALTADQNMLEDFTLSNIDLSSTDVETKANLAIAESYTGGHLVGSIDYHYQPNNKTETLDLDINAKDHTIFKLTEQGQSVTAAHALPQRITRIFKAFQSDNFDGDFTRILQDQYSLNNSGSYTSKFSIDLPDIKLPDNPRAKLRNLLPLLGYSQNTPLALKLDITTDSKPKTARTTHLTGFIKLDHAATVHMDSSLTFNQQQFAKKLGKLLSQPPKNNDDTRLHYQLLTQLIDADNQNTFLNNLTISYEDQSLLPNIYKLMAKSLSTDPKRPVSSQDVADHFANVAQNSKFGPAFAPYKNTVVQFIKNPKELTLSITPEQPLPMSKLYAFKPGQEGELIHLLNVKLTNQA
ncbi:hypothetical protein [Piscirickettsia litoralis]|uniref:DUF945 domain-containing protein n=1 Tax=Piscirickettsia litoralis TaxID=1891921 RepID=A0ABX3A610_9GAMM|nr:hypothetical protein [Piscirickettsia litoralis]ODN42905.1 hypothetical protein BGC07_08170 [Piscirickettsia litoralis]